MAADENRILWELVRAHRLQRAIYRRFVCALVLAITVDSKYVAATTLETRTSPVAGA